MAIKPNKFSGTGIVKKLSLRPPISPGIESFVPPSLSKVTVLFAGYSIPPIVRVGKKSALLH